MAEKQDFKGQSFHFNHRISFDTKRPIPQSSEENSYTMIKFDKFTHYVQKTSNFSSICEQNLTNNLSKNVITYLDDLFMQSQTKHEMFKILENFNQI